MYHSDKKKVISKMKGTVFVLDTHSSNAITDVLDKQHTQAVESLELFDLVEKKMA